MQQDRVVTQPQPSPSSEVPASQQSSGNALQGEGNHDAARRHRESVEGFVESGQVEAAARDAAPHDAAEARAMEAAEAEGKAHAKGEDPALQRARDRQE